MPPCSNRVCTPVRRFSSPRPTAIQVLGSRPMRRLRIPARMGATTWPRRARSAAMVRVASGGTWQRRVQPGMRVRPLSAEFPELAAGLPDGAAVVPGQAAGLGGESGGGEPAGGLGQGERRRRGGADPWLVQVAAGDPASPGPGGQWARIQLIPGPRSRLITAVPMTQNGLFWISTKHTPRITNRRKYSAGRLWNASRAP
jgi:hypothetical protein